MWTQIVGKIRLTHAPMVNHWWRELLGALHLPACLAVVVALFAFLGSWIVARYCFGGDRKS